MSRKHRRASRFFRWGIATVFTLVAHVLVLLLLAMTNFFQAFSPRSSQPIDSKPVTLRSFSASSWEANRRIETQVRPAPSKNPWTPTAPKKVEPEPLPQGKVVDVAPGNGVAPDPDAAFLAEKNNRVEKQTRSRHATPFYKNAMPQPSSTLKTRKGQGDSPAEIEVIAGNGGKGHEPPKENPRHRSSSHALEIPRQEKKDQLSLQFDPQGTLRNQISQDEIKGNSSRFRLRGEGNPETPPSSGRAGNGELLSLTPSSAVLERIAGAPANDTTPMDDVELGEGTFLNTREFKHATFFNRVKQNVGMHWDPNTMLLKRDPSGEIFLYKDRYTVVSVILAKDGALKSVGIDRSCGVDFLDSEAVAAFQRAQPFPNPPAALQDERGEIRFRFGFYFEAPRSFP